MKFHGDVGAVSAAMRRLEGVAPCAQGAPLCLGEQAGPKLDLIPLLPGKTASPETKRTAGSCITKQENLLFLFLFFKTMNSFKEPGLLTNGPSLAARGKCKAQGQPYRTRMISRGSCQAVNPQRTTHWEEEEPRKALSPAWVHSHTCQDKSMALYRSCVCQRSLPSRFLSPLSLSVHCAYFRSGRQQASEIPEPPRRKPHPTRNPAA